MNKDILVQRLTALKDEMQCTFTPFIWWKRNYGPTRGPVPPPVPASPARPWKKTKTLYSMQ